MLLCVRQVASYMMSAVHVPCMGIHASMALPVCCVVLCRTLKST